MQLQVIFMKFAILASLQLAVTMASASVECALVPNARISLPYGAQGDLFGRANHGHQIESGKAAVLTIRSFGGDDAVIDSHVFNKLTIELTGSVIYPNVPPVFSAGRAFYSEGGVGFITKGEYWWGIDPDLSIALVKSEGGINVSIRGTVALTHGRGEKKRLRELDFNCPVLAKNLSDLTPWEGKPGTGWDSFSPVSN